MMGRGREGEYFSPELTLYFPVDNATFKERMKCERILKKGKSNGKLKKTLRKLL